MSAPRTRPDLGLYQGKYLLRRLMAPIPGIERLSPNAISLAALVPCALAAVALAQGWWLLLIAGVVGRMLLTTLDGLVAETYAKRTRVGAWLNRLVAEVGDTLILAALFARADAAWVVAVIGLAWLVNMLGVLGLVAGGSIQSVGPAGQTDRQAIFVVLAVLSLFVTLDWTVVCMVLAALLALTIVLRVRRTVRELNALGPA